MQMSGRGQCRESGLKVIVCSPTGAWECAGTVSIPPVLLAPDHRPLFRSTSHRIRPYSMAKTWGIQDDAERDVTADSQAQRKIIHSRIIVTIGHASWEAGR